MYYQNQKQTNRPKYLLKKKNRKHSWERKDIYLSDQFQSCISVIIFSSIFCDHLFVEKMSAFRWKNFDEEEDRPEKPRSCGVTEMRGPDYNLLSQNVLQVLFFLYMHTSFLIFLLFFIIFLKFIFCSLELDSIPPC